MKSFHKDYRPPTKAFPAYQKKKPLWGFKVAIILLIVLLLISARLLFRGRINTNINTNPKLVEDTSSTQQHPSTGDTSESSESVAEQLVMEPEAKIPHKAIIWSRDSSEYGIECSAADLKTCLNGLSSIRPQLGRYTYSLFNSFIINTLESPIQALEVNFQKGQSNNIPTLSSVKVKGFRKVEKYTITKPFVPYLKGGAGDTLFFWGRYCNQENLCLQNYQGKFLQALEGLAQGCTATENCKFHFSQNSNLGAVLSGVSSQEVFPLIMGRVTTMKYSQARGFSVQLYHGKGIFVWYQNLSEIKKGLLVGDILNPVTPLGLAGNTQDSLSTFALKVMIEGKLVNLEEIIKTPLTNEKVTI